MSNVAKVRCNDVTRLSKSDVVKRCTVTDIPTALNNKMIEVASDCGLSKREFTMLAWHVLMKKLGKGSVRFPERPYLKAKLKSLMGEGYYETQAKLGKRP